eukprot:3824600-Rhodomonas_salina.1
MVLSGGRNSGARDQQRASGSASTTREEPAVTNYHKDCNGTPSEQQQRGRRSSEGADRGRGAGEDREGRGGRAQGREEGEGDGEGGRDEGGGGQEEEGGGHKASTQEKRLPYPPFRSRPPTPLRYCPTPAYAISGTDVAYPATRRR